MGKSLTEIAQQLKDANKKVQLIYAFNGVGKTRLSREFKELILPKISDEEDAQEESELKNKKILYYSGFTEDLFYWDNDNPKLKIQPNSFTDWVLKDQGQDRNIITNFQRYANEKLTPRFNEEYKTKKDDKEITVKAFSEVTFSLERGDDEHSGNLKISKGEESNFIWSIFYTLLEQVIVVLNVPEPSEREINDFDQLEYIFIDDPVSSLDENHLIELAVNLAELIKLTNLKFIITTHNPLFYNVLYNELNNKVCYFLELLEDGTFTLTEKQGDSNKSFSYHLYLKQTLEQAIAENKVQKYHFTLLRNLYEKTASFLGYPKWSELLPDDKQLYFNRIIQFTSHSTLSNETVSEPTPQEKEIVRFLLEHLIKTGSFWTKEK
jgi:wobble nucleotide-excising tRNase